MTFQAGQRLTAQALRNALLLEAYKGSDQSVTSNSTTLVNDTALALALQANATYLVEFLVFYTGGTAGSSDWKYGVTVPSGATISPIRELGLTTGLAVQYLTVPAGGAFGSNGTGNKMAAEMKFTIVTSAAGTLQLQWCQNTSSATATTVKAGSSLVAWQLA